MPPTAEPQVISSVHFDASSPHHRDRLTELYTAYLLEELDRTGQGAPGAPVATYLRTLLISVDGTVAGFISVDVGRCSVELIYLQPDHRRRGIAGQLLAELRDTCPQPLQAKAPLTPTGQALARSLGIEVTQPPAHEEEHARRTLAALHQALAANCPHRLPRGAPGRSCRRCYRRVLKDSARQMVDLYSALMTARRQVVAA